MAKRSAGILLYRCREEAELEVLLVHPGGPYWAKKDEGAWSIPKGEYVEEAPLDCAKREFAEELGISPPTHGYVALGEVRQPGGKHVQVWAVQGDFDPERLVSATFELEWPPKSSRMQSFPEVDRAAWFSMEEARRKLLAGQLPFLDRLLEALKSTP